MHNNYMLQVQCLINQKAIEAPGEKRDGGNFGNVLEACFCHNRGNRMWDKSRPHVLITLWL